MKQAVFPLMLLLAACASPPPTGPAGVGSLAPANEEAEILAAVQEAVDKGFQVVTENGQTLYCRKDLKTGSRVQSNLTCLTKDQLADQRRGSFDYVNNMQRGNPNPLPEGGVSTKP